jgi:hypothetical protein
MSDLLLPDIFFGWLDVRQPTKAEMDEYYKEKEREKQQQERAKAAKAAKQDEAQHKQKLAQIKAQVEYEARRDRLDDVARELLDSLPTSAKLVETLRKARYEAVTILSKPDPTNGADYAAALAVLQKVKIEDALAAGRKLDAAASEKAAGTYKVASKQATDITARLDAPTSLLTQEATDGLRAKLTAQTKRLRTPAFDASLDRDVRAELSKIDADVTKHEDFATNVKATLEDRRQAANLRLADLQTTLTDTQYALLARHLGGLDALVADRDFIAGVDLIDAFNGAADKAEADAKPGKELWASNSGQIPALLKTAREQLASASPAVKDKAAEAIATLEGLQQETPGKTITYALAVQKLQECNDLVGGLKSESEKFGAFVGEREEAAKAVKEAAAEVTAALLALDKMVKEVDESAAEGAASADSREQFTALTTGFEERSKTAFDAAGLDAEGTIAKLISLAEAINKAASSGDTVAGLITEQVLATARAGYEAARGKASSEIERVRGMNASEAGTFAAKLPAIDDTVKSATLAAEIAKPVKDVEALEKDAKSRGDELAAELLEEQTNRTKQADALALKLGELDEAVKAIGNDKRRADYEKLHAALLAGLEQQRAMIALPQLSLLSAAEPELVKLGSDIDDAIAAAKGAESWFGGDVVNFTDIKGYIADMKKRLAETELRRFLGTSVFQKTQELSEIEKSVGSDPIIDLRRKIATLGRSITALEAKLVDVTKDYAAFVKQVETIKAKLKGDIFGPVPKYTESLKGELDATLPQAASEGGLPNAQQEAQRLSTLVDTYLKDNVRDRRGVPVALADREKEAVAADQADKENGAKWDGAYNVLSGELDRLSGIDRAELGNLKKTLNDANKNFKKDGVYDAAMARLRAVRERVELLRANPQGLKLSSRNRLPEVNQKWKDGLVTFRDDLKATGDALMVERDNGLDTAGSKAVTATLASVRALFSAAAFDKPLAAMTSASGTDKTRAAAREEALRDLRRFRAYLNEDYRLQELARNPWVKSMNGTLAGLNSALADLETNMMASL